MRQDLLPPEEPAPRPARPRLRRAVLLRAGVAVLALSVAVGGLLLSRETRSPVSVAEAPSQLVASLEAEAASALPALESEALDALRGAYREAAAPPVADTPTEVQPATPFAEQAPVAPPETQAAETQSAEAQPTDPTPQVVPLPVQRPAELRRFGAQEAPRVTERRGRRARVAAAPPAPEDDRNFFEKFFGIQPPASPALAYAALETPSVDRLPRQKLTPPPAPTPGASGGTAVYDISAHTVTLPNGERLEAHSGLGSNMDDPRYVNQRMRGPTPPGTYDLTEREALFHGVRAIRLTPVGGAEAVYGRNGLLAHTYMLGPQGASNGCVSFRDYNKFLQAFLRGEIARLVVVPGRSDGVPALASQPSKAPARSARNGGDA